jgi:hypothetical protein
MKRMQKNPKRKKYDEPPEGYRRYTAYIKIELFEQFMSLLGKKQSVKDALNDAIQDYVDGHQKSARKG